MHVACAPHLHGMPISEEHSTMHFKGGKYLAKLTPIYTGSLLHVGSHSLSARGGGGGQYKLGYKGLLVSIERSSHRQVTISIKQSQMSSLSMVEGS